MGTDVNELDRTLLRMALPALGTLAAEPLYVVVDTAIVGRLGTPQLAGLAVASQVLVLVASLCNFLAYGTNQRIAFHLGAGRESTAAAVARLAVRVAMVAGCALGALIGLLARPICSALGASGAALDAASTYLRIGAVGIPAVLVALAAQGILRAHRRLANALVIVVVANVANLVIEIVAVWGLHLGIAGSAWSTTMVQLGTVAVYLRAVAPQLRDADPVLPPGELRALASVGGHLIVRVLALMATFTTATAIASRAGATVGAAHQIVNSSFLLLALVLDALAIPAQTLVAEAMGAGDPSAMRAIAGRVLVWSLRFGVLLGAVLATSAPIVTRIFSADDHVQRQATWGLVVLAVSLVPGAIAFGYDGVMIGAGLFPAMSRLMVVTLALFALTLSVWSVASTLNLVAVWTSLGVWLGLRALGAFFITRRRFMGQRHYSH